MKNPFVILKFVGTDAFLMHSFLPHMSLGFKLKALAKRVLVKFLDRYVVQEYIVDHWNLENHLRKAGLTKPCREIKDPVWYPKRMTPVIHDGFNIVYYNPSGHKKNKEAIAWRYGIDLIEQAKKKIKGVTWIEIDGTADMKEIWPITDFYLRPCRIDGASRMRQECDINHIPYYWTYENPDIDSIVKAIQKAKRHEMVH